ncbi:MAG: hypothetical protein KY456_08740 [Chloroflexi bacterium]|nr:hypothetical protein [Chloroflexota bacterium]
MAIERLLLQAQGLRQDEAFQDAGDEELTVRIELARPLGAVGATSFSPFSTGRTVNASTISWLKPSWSGPATGVASCARAPGAKPAAPYAAAAPARTVARRDGDWPKSRVSR